MPLTPEAKKLLAETIRGTAQDPEKGLRARLLRAIHDEADRRYRLAVPIAEAGLDEAHRKRRERIAAWVDERARATKPKNDAERKTTRERLLAQAEKEAAATLLNRLVLLRHLEAHGLSRPPVLTGGWNSKGYREFREFAPTLCTNGMADATEGYGTLLQFLFDELAIDLPGLFGDVGLTRLFPIPAATLRDAVERLDDPGLASAWSDDTTLGWVYQYWNDPDREALDAKINDGGKIAPHEIASKTQMFTERYMVEWLLQNSLGLTWLAMCRKHGWTPDADRVLPALDMRRAEWRAKRDAGKVALDALMPIQGELEEHWKYYVPQPIPDDAVTHAPDSIRTLKLLDPACGSGHFLVIAFDLLASLYREEARHRGEAPTSDRDIAESILENNLYGIDIDPRAVQIAAAALYLKTRTFAKDTRLHHLNLVAPALQLGKLPDNDPAVVALLEGLKREAGIPETLGRKLLTSLAGVDYLGSLLKVDAAVDGALKNVELEFERSTGQGDIFKGFPAQQVKLSVGEAKATVLDKLEQFLAKHSTVADLGLRLDGEQLAAGVRFVRMAKEGTYDVVVGNPPYQGISKTSQFEYVAKEYPRGKADLYAAFLERGLQLARAGGISALLTMRGWMFLGQFTSLRQSLLHRASVRLGDSGWGAFELMTDNPVTMALAVKTSGARDALALAPTDPTARVRTDEHRRSLQAGLLAQAGRYEFDPRGFEVIEGEPVVYWWSKEFLARYAAAPKLGAVSPARFGVNTGDNVRFLRKIWEPHVSVDRTLWTDAVSGRMATWTPFVKGAQGKEWFEPAVDAVRWSGRGLELKVSVEHHYGNVAWKVSNEPFYFVPGIAFTMIGQNFAARAHRYASVIGDKGSSVYPSDIAATLCAMNRRESRDVLQSINPTISFQVGDVNRLPVLRVADSSAILAIVDHAFSEHESSREPSVEFLAPGRSAWNYAQSWAQLAIDRPDDAQLPAYEPVYDPPKPESFISFAVGVALGRFSENGAGILDTAPTSALHNGILFLSTERADSLDHPACAPLVAAWNKPGAAISSDADLRTFLRKSFFDFHKKLYENRPIYFPLSSAKKSFVAFVSIHRWADDTLSVLLADHLVPSRRRLEGELDDLRTARASAGANKGKLEKRFTEVQKALEELTDFIAKVSDLAEKGPPGPDDKTTKREVDARYAMDLDDGVMVNSATLWPVLEPQWKDPKKWWKELANATGKKDYDWSHLAARYFPTRVRAKCHEDPSLAVAHGCFWELHPAKAYAWELRLQDEIHPDFTIDEPGSDAARAAFLRAHASEAREIEAKERKRRQKKGVKEEEQTELAYEAGGEEEGADE